LVSLLIAALMGFIMMGFIIQNHKIKTRTLIVPLVVFIGIAIVLAVLTVVQQSSADTTTLATPTIPTEPRAPDGPPGGRLTADSWTIFGGIAKQVGSDGTTIRIDTHDTTQNWHTKWSGLVASGLPGCGWKISGRVHDLSHRIGEPGGLGIGLASFDSAEVPSGTAAQFDYGFSGYRATDYPSDSTLQQVQETLDNEWHEFDVVVGTDGRLKATIDDRPVLDAQGKTVCCYPMIRIWAGVNDQGIPPGLGSSNSPGSGLLWVV
jgi:hypothetical protein